MNAEIEADWLSKRLLTPREIINITIGAAIYGKMPGVESFLKAIDSFF
jgi:hypothetical protein